VPKEEVTRNKTILKSRFQKYTTLTHTKEKHRVFPLEENTIKCHKTSKYEDFEDIVVVDT
jgi:hypothetical protein